MWWDLWLVSRESSYIHASEWNSILGVKIHLHFWTTQVQSGPIFCSCLRSKSIIWCIKTKTYGAVLFQNFWTKTVTHHVRGLSRSHFLNSQTTLCHKRQSWGSMFPPTWHISKLTEASCVMFDIQHHHWHYLPSRSLRRKWHDTTPLDMVLPPPASLLTFQLKSIDVFSGSLTPVLQKNTALTTNALQKSHLFE